MPSTLADSPVFLGIDGGGSRTRALVASLDGKVAGFGRAGPANPSDLGADAAIQSMQMAVAGAWKDAREVPRPIAGAFVGLAGAGAFGRSHNREKLIDWLPRVEAATVEIDHDLRVAHAGAFAGGEGIVVISGTGSAAYGRNAAGISQVAGGHGPLLDDVGSGYWLGLEALRIATKVSEGRIAPSLLWEEIRAKTGTTNSAELREWVTAKQGSRREIAAIAIAVFEAKAKGDLFARLLVDAGASELAQLAGAVNEKLFPSHRAPVALIGGLSQNDGYKNAFREALERLPRPLRAMVPLHTPVVGAWGLAVKKAGQLPSYENLPEGGS